MSLIRETTLNEIKEGFGVNDIAGNFGIHDRSSCKIFQNCLKYAYETEIEKKGSCSWARENPKDKDSLWLKFKEGKETLIPKPWIEFALNKVTNGKELTSSGYRIDKYDPINNCFVCIMPLGDKVIITKCIKNHQPLFSFRIPHTNTRFESSAIWPAYDAQAQLDAQHIFGENSIISTLNLEPNKNNYTATIIIENPHLLVEVSRNLSFYNFRTANGNTASYPINRLPNSQLLMYRLTNPDRIKNANTKIASLNKERKKRTV